MELIKYLPVYMGKIREINELTMAEQPEIDNVFDAITSVSKENFVETATDYGLSRLEKIYGIKYSGYEDMSFRKFRLMLKISGNKNRNIVERLNDIFGEGNYSMEYNPLDNVLSVGITVENKDYIDETKKMLDKLVPCNIILDVRVLYVSHKMLERYTHKELSKYKNEGLKLIGLQ